MVVILVVGDLVAITAGVALARELRFLVPDLDSLVSPRPSVPSAFVLILAALWMGSVVSWQLYQRDFCVAGIEEYRRAVAAGFSAIGAAIALAYAIVLPLSRGYLVLALGFGILAVCANRFLVRRLIYLLARRGHRLDRVLVVGASREGVALAAQLQGSPSASAEVVGFLDEYRPVGHLLNETFRILGEPLDLWRTATQLQVTKAILIPSALTWESLQALIPHLRRRSPLTVMFAPGLHDLNTQVEARQLGPVLLAVPRPQEIVGVGAMQKRALDLLVATIVLALSLPFLVAICGWLWVRTGRWPVRGRQVVGRAGQRFSVLEIGGSPRLSRARLARLPSLIAVLTGKLSLVGPRPLSLDELTRYQQWTELLLSVRPGFIGPWWETPPVTPAEEIQLDLRYLQTYSPWSDLQILWHAAGRMLGRRPSQAVVAGV
jgi:lipopolysaccharide/colanic/teichoic acid biosynthesis glycosyltransferase